MTSVHPKGIPPTATRGRRRVWIAWERQRRSITLSKRVGAELHILDLENRGWLRYPLSIIATGQLLFAARRGVVFVQNPSMILATFAGACKHFFNYTLVVDRHSNFLQGDEDFGPVTRWALEWMSRYSIRRADLTIVTNADIEEKYIRGRGRGFILPDPYPEITTRPVRLNTERRNLEVLFVSTWQTDEPIREVIEVCRRMGDQIKVFISGKMKETYRALVEAKPDNFVLTGFLSDEEYFNLMASVDCVLAISTRPGTLCCGTYEAVTLGKPVVVNSERITREYFSAGAVYTDSTPDDLEAQLRHVMAHREQLEADVREFYVQSTRAWSDKLDMLNQTIQDIQERSLSAVRDSALTERQHGGNPRT